MTVEVGEDVAEYGQVLSPKEYKRRSAKMRKKMLAAANNLEFEKAAKLRDELLVLERRMIDSA